MKKRILCGISACLCAVMLSMGVLAAPPISVTLDGAPLTFAANAAPVLEKGRTFVPFRPIFEAMGAQVAWDNATRTVSAARGGTTVRFVVGEKNMTVTQAGETRTAATDAPSFVRSGVTYVPVRFAAQAFGANVGWDAAAQTAVIVDVGALTPAGNFSIMNAYLALAAPTESREISGEVKLLYTAHTAAGDVMVPMTMTVSGRTDTLSASLKVKTVTDIAAMKTALAASEDALPENVANLLTTLENGSYEVIFSRPDSAMYLRGPSLTELGAAEGAWVRLPLDAALRPLSLGTLGEDAYAGAMRHDFAQYVVGAAALLPIKSAADDNFGAARAQVDSLAARYHDEKFTTHGGIFELQEAAVTADGAAVQNTLRLTESGAGGIGVAAHEQTVSRGEQVVLRSSLQRDAQGSMTAQIDIASTSYNAALTAMFTSTPASGIPLRRPV